MELQFASPELERLYTDNIGADQYTAETVTLFRRRIRHIEAAKDLRDLQRPGGVRYTALGSAHPGMSTLALNDSWCLVLSEQDNQEGKQILVLEISKRFEGGA